MDNQNKHLLFESIESLGKVAILIEKNGIVPSQEIANVLSAKNIEVGVIEVSNQAGDLIDKAKWQDFSRVFLALTQEHYLSSGHIQGLLDNLGLDYTGSGMLPAALSNDRIKCKKLWQAMGIATPPFIKWGPNVNWQEIISLLGFPLAVRSAFTHDKRVFKVMHMDHLQEACQYFIDLNAVIVEPWITGDSYTVYILDGQVLLPLEVGNQSTNITNSMQKLAMAAFTAIGGQGIGSVDIVKDLSDDCWVLSMDLVPTIASHSRFNEAASNYGINWESLIERILATSFIKKSNNKMLCILR